MPAESLKSEKSDPIPMAPPWPTLMKNPPNQGEELMKAKKKVMETKSVLESKTKTCICSPTSHAGSFRCHLHRANATQDSSCCNSVANGVTKLNSKSQGRDGGGGREPILSRFGRASSQKLKPIPESSLPA
ncbi:hypothetical protein REPUB_Repub12eG0077600 [Reevesia pubescens]